MPLFFIECQLYVMWNLENSLHNLHYVDLTLDSSDISKSDEWQFHIIAVFCSLRNYHLPTLLLMAQGLAQRILYRRKASNSRPSPWSDARSYQHKAVGELHRQKAGMFSLLQSIDALVQELQVRLAAFQDVVLDGHCYQSIY